MIGFGKRTSRYTFWTSCQLRKIKFLSKGALYLFSYFASLKNEEIYRKKSDKQKHCFKKDFLQQSDQIFLDWIEMVLNFWTVFGKIGWVFFSKSEIDMVLEGNK